MSVVNPTNMALALANMMALALWNLNGMQEQQHACARKGAKHHPQWAEHFQAKRIPVRVKKMR
jgi:hypothetical protein